MCLALRREPSPTRRRAAGVAGVDAATDVQGALGPFGVVVSIVQKKVSVLVEQKGVMELPNDIIE
ncbi:hypothetical protein V7S43_010101 [Phytophthora oleae]|uniref:Uncharacterized protein n=1 Tax=Phytophthora oleae TaxID=2107226 RepID=A0ABD3FIY1_9STRA